MGKSKLEKRVGSPGGMVLACMLMVLVLGMLMLVGQVNEANDTERVEAPQSIGTAWIVDDHDQHDDKTIGNEVLPAPTVEPVSDALAVATMNDYAKLEASRIAKMAAVLMGMGGEYAASCRVVYNSATEKTEAKYKITWSKTPRSKEGHFIAEAWPGASWAECIQAMLAWKGGE